MAETIRASMEMKDNSTAVIRKTTAEVKKYTKEINTAKKASNSF